MPSPHDGEQSREAMMLELGVEDRPPTSANAVAPNRKSVQQPPRASEEYLQIRFAHLTV